MPARLKAELGQQPMMVPGLPPSASNSSSQLPTISRSAGFPSGSLSGSLLAITTTEPGLAGGLGSGAALNGSRGFERKPSVIREALKQQQQVQQQQSQGTPRAGQQPNDQGPLVQLASALAGQGPERVSGQRPERRSSLMPQQQILAAPSRSSVNGGSVGPGALLLGGQLGGQMGQMGQLSAGPQPAMDHPGARRSDPGDGFRSRALVPGPLDVAPLYNARGLNRSWGSGADETSPGAGESPGPFPPQPSPSGILGREALRQGMGSRGELVPGGELGGIKPGSQSGDLRLPRVSARGRNGAVRDKDRERDTSSSAPVPRASVVSQADVAAITEAMAAYQSEAGRLRAKALRRVDTKIKRAVLEKHLGPEPEYHGPPIMGGYSSNALTPTLRVGQLRPGQVAITPPSPPQPAPDVHRVGITTGSGLRTRPQESLPGR
ncbi:hypothetical protein GPECTOR_2g1365 [Gonium pectorale]|uniref:Uncharacterized protein n=1 Tax=Gonium pectorale TaxID=33097 RepID=A0A150H192_GONPE|nr:hypothetical protein GPECTOR_2g1365 [Gonium pectorale]|eukprot:KXZ55814.1 hypothetical protein GPECTOR_2g1365 [Gonium pectorale]